ncbi:ubiquinol-cytochrome C chaperone family protein [Sandaracinobacteroides saxicola]|uniref:Ubiquinol-cytochrome C chaperone family protein n=1 Tax=Sandaracinobacteroides saxicola TaxID=2759707 RepID=A0A7G5IF45_9SPHN|nr:ubiquinol-cytochrome C chaperone family protein [Sandaracinobacteroides saxicola]QMW21987.1 ubiquinol-cytochrome C chaperone family protein [Sandaracinobacteroides saxicola]
MSFLTRLFTPKRRERADLWDAIVRVAREERWYLRHGVPDTVDGRFDMVALVTSLVMLRFEREGALQDSAWLTESFVDDMDGSLRQLGIGDMVIGKHMGKVTGSLGGRIDGYRRALEPEADRAALAAALVRNVWRGAAPDETAPAELAAAVVALKARLDALPGEALLNGRF